jgi:putative membrane protein
MSAGSGNGARIALGLGLGVLALAWIGPLPELASHSFSAHMLMHVAVVAVAAPLLAVGVAGTRLDPAVLLPALAAPVPSSVLELVIVWGWHAPVLHHMARHLPGALVWEQAMFLAASVLVWSAAVGGPPRLRTARAGAGVIALLLTSMHMTLLGALLTVAPRPLYAHGDGMLGLGALQDQQLGGVIMLAFGGVSYLIGGLVLLARLLRTAPAGTRG